MITARSFAPTTPTGYSRSDEALAWKRDREARDEDHREVLRSMDMRKLGFGQRSSHCG